jgi:hypothetical protein
MHGELAKAPASAIRNRSEQSSLSAATFTRQDDEPAHLDTLEDRLGKTEVLVDDGVLDRSVACSRH